MAESFKTNLEQFLVGLIKKIMELGDQSELEQIQKGYDEIMDECK